MAAGTAAKAAQVGRRAGRIPDPGSAVDRFPGELAAEYQPLRLLGAGAMGEVFLARDRRLGRLVAVKLRSVAGPASSRERFRREAATMARLHHPNLARLYTFGQLGGRDFLVMEHIDGRPLPAVATAGLPAMLGVARALDQVHEAGLVHRDVKPANILLDPGERAVLVDFGLVFDPSSTPLTGVGQVAGTLAYMAPEVLMGRSMATAACDWYSWGVTLFMLIERRLPFERDELVHLRIEGKLPPPRFSRVRADTPIAVLLARCLSDDPGRRPRSSREIERYLAHAAAKTRELRIGSRGFRSSGIGSGARVPASPGPVAAVGLLATGGGSPTGTGLGQTRRTPHRA